MTHSVSLRVGGLALMAGALANMLFWRAAAPARIVLRDQGRAASASPDLDRRGNPLQLPPLVPLGVFFSGSALWGMGAVSLGLHLWRTSAAGKEDWRGAKRFKSAWSSLIRPTEESLEA
jgi:hypothetical protein